MAKSLKSLFVARNGRYSFRLYTKAPNGKHQAVEFGTGTMTGTKVHVDTPEGGADYDSPVEAISAATEKGYAVVGG
jgi:hypothetical protein